MEFLFDFANPIAWLGWIGIAYCGVIAIDLLAVEIVYAVRDAKAKKKRRREKNEQREQD